GERHLLQAPGEKHFQEMAGRDAEGFCIRYQRAPLCHAQQKAARRPRISDSLSRIGIAPGRAARRCCLAASGISEKEFRTARAIFRGSEALEKHTTRDRVSSQILVRR